MPATRTDEYDLAGCGCCGATTGCACRCTNCACPDQLFGSPVTLTVYPEGWPSFEGIYPLPWFDCDDKDGRGPPISFQLQPCVPLRRNSSGTGNYCDPAGGIPQEAVNELLWGPSVIPGCRGSTPRDMLASFSVMWLSDPMMNNTGFKRRCRLVITTPLDDGLNGEVFGAALPLTGRVPFPPIEQAARWSEGMFDAYDPLFPNRNTCSPLMVRFPYFVMQAYAGATRISYPGNLAGSAVVTL
jgi:hypothetical protein